MDDSMYFAQADGQFKQQFDADYSNLHDKVAGIPNFIPSSGSGFALSLSANGKASTGDIIKNH